jgi:orotate phosphoribosyltransferase/uridine monophosphate synthetase
MRKLIGHPKALWRAAFVMHEEITALQSMRNPQMEHFDLVAGIPMGGLLIATAYSLAAEVPMVYLHPVRDGDAAFEGVFEPGQTAIIMDDLVTGGGSIAGTADRLRESGLNVRMPSSCWTGAGARERLRKDGITCAPP